MDYVRRVDSDSEDDEVEIIPVVEDDDDRKMPAKKSVANASRLKAAVQGEDVDVEALVKEGVDRTALKNAEDGEIRRFNLVPIASYQELISKAVSAEFYKRNGPEETKKIEKNLFRSDDARKGLHRMVNINIQIVDLFMKCGMDVFTGQKPGITRYLQMLMSK